MIDDAQTGTHTAEPAGREPSPETAGTTVPILAKDVVLLREAATYSQTDAVLTLRSRLDAVREMLPTLGPCGVVVSADLVCDVKRHRSSHVENVRRWECCLPAGHDGPHVPPVHGADEAV